MRIAFFALLAFAISAQAGEPASVYTKLDTKKDCTVFASAGEGAGDWANLVCTGYKGYPVYLYHSDLRESVHYGFTASPAEPSKWESFAGFNSTSGTIEWRLAGSGDQKIPFATIHRWSIEESGRKSVEVLAIEKVGQISNREGCAVGYVVATKNPNANVQAREVADTLAAGFKCGLDQPAIRQGSVPLPQLMVQER
ncbi:MAG: hypothetical protein ACR2OR_16705 [Hyphomicrobiales bacterium]